MQHTHDHLKVTDSHGQTLFCEFTDTELVALVISNNSRYFWAYMVASVVMLIFFIKFRRMFWSGSASRYMQFIEIVMIIVYLGITVFVFGCGVGHELRAQVFYTKHPDWFWAEANWEFYFGYWSIIVAVLMVCTIIKILFDKSLAAAISTSIHGVFKLLRYSAIEKEIYTEKLREADDRFNAELSKLREIAELHKTQGTKEQDE